MNANKSFCIQCPSPIELIFHSPNLNYCKSETNSLSRAKRQMAVSANLNGKALVCSGSTTPFFHVSCILGNPIWRTPASFNCRTVQLLMQHHTLGRRIQRENENGTNTTKIFCIYPLLWRVVFPRGSHSCYIIQAETVRAVLYCNYYTQVPSVGEELHDSTHPPIRKNSVMAPHGSLATNYTDVQFDLNAFQR